MLPMAVNLTELENTLLAKRRAGRVVLESHPVGEFRSHSARETLDAYVQRLGLFSLGADWIRIDNLAALQVLIEVLYREQVHGQPLMQLHEAASLAAQIVSLFEADNPRTLFFTNRDADRWLPLAEGTYDSGVIFLDSLHVGMLWVLDTEEDL